MNSIVYAYWLTERRVMVAAKDEEARAAIVDAAADEDMSRQRRPWSTPKLLVESTESVVEKPHYYKETSALITTPIGPS
jgi:hypothetical protein